MYVKCGAVKKAQEVFNDLLVRNDVSWNALISVYVHCSLNGQALELFGVGRLRLLKILQT